MLLYNDDYIVLSTPVLRSFFVFFCLCLLFFVLISVDTTLYSFASIFCICNFISVHMFNKYNYNYWMIIVVSAAAKK